MVRDRAARLIVALAWLELVLPALAVAVLVTYLAVTSAALVV